MQRSLDLYIAQRSYYVNFLPGRFRLVFIIRPLVQKLTSLFNCLYVEGNHLFVGEVERPYLREYRRGTTAGSSTKRTGATFHHTSSWPVTTEHVSTTHGCHNADNIVKCG